MAAAAGVRRVLLFHHDPDYTDEEGEHVHTEVRAALEARGGAADSEPAREGTTYCV